jgi:hypothetical protein
MLFGLSVSSAFAADFPNKTVRLIVPFPPGGATDALARLMAESESNNARLATLMNRLEAVGSSTVPGQPSATDLSGARLEMEMLRQRLDALQDDPTAPDAAHRSSAAANDRAGTTPTPRSVAGGN